MKEANFEALANNLVWKIGKDEVSGRVIVRVGLASSLTHWGRLPKLRQLTDSELSEALKADSLITEWVE